MTVDAALVAHWQQWIGRSERRTERVEVESLRRYAAALGESLDVEQSLPSLAHWACFLPMAGPGDLGPDGHPRRGGFLPPVTLPRRMFAASVLRFPAPLIPGREATRVSTIAGVTHKPGRSGDLLLVEVEQAIEQAGRVRVQEHQTIVYRDAGAPVPAIVPADLPAIPDAVLWCPRSVDLFRFSAATFNSHRIHYDLPYAMDEEGYPGLVVHGPFTAARLFGVAAARTGPPAEFAFRAAAPLFADQPIALAPDGEGGVKAVRCDGVTAMTARVK